MARKQHKMTQSDVSAVE